MVFIISSNEERAWGRFSASLYMVNSFGRYLLNCLVLSQRRVPSVLRDFRFVPPRRPVRSRLFWQPRHPPVRLQTQYIFEEAPEVPYWLPEKSQGPASLSGDAFPRRSHRFLFQTNQISLRIPKFSHSFCWRK